MRVLSSGIAAVFFSITFAGCATSDRDRLGGGSLIKGPGEEWGEETVSRRRKPRTERNLEAKKMSVTDVAAGYRTPEDCERGAKKLYHSNPGGAWALLRACVYERGLADLRPLLDLPWSVVMRKRWTESAKLLTYVIAKRGGNLGLDLRFCQERQMPFVTLAAAFDDPEGHLGKLVVMRGLVIDGEPSGRGMKVKLAETSFAAENFDRYAGSYAARRHASRSGGRRSLSRRRGRGGRVTIHSQNVSAETGREVMASAASATQDKLQLDTEYVFLVRFKGTKTIKSEDPFQEPFGVASIVEYYTPSEALIF